jgi:hypothetical protein
MVEKGGSLGATEEVQARHPVSLRGREPYEWQPSRGTATVFLTACNHLEFAFTQYKFYPAQVLQLCWTLLWHDMGMASMHPHISAA